MLAAVRIGSLNPELIWREDGISLWIIEIDGVTRRLRSDGEDERIWRTFTERGINLHAELIPRSRFKRMVEGSSRTAFTCNFFSTRELVYCADPSIESWFAEANTVATKDQEKELFEATTWLIHAHRYGERLLSLKKDLLRTVEAVQWAAHSMAAIEIIRRREVCEDGVLARAKEHEPDLFAVVYDAVFGRKPTKKALRAALDRIESYLDERCAPFLDPLRHLLRKEKRIVPLSEIGDHFAFSQLYPWHLESACEWLELRGELEKVAAPFQITKRSPVEVEEPAYFFDA